MKILRRLTAAMLALVMVVTMLPVSVLATETQPTIPETTAETEPVDVGEVVLDVPLTDETETVETVPETTEAVMETDVATEPAETVPETTALTGTEETIPEETLHIEVSGDSVQPLYSPTIPGMQSNVPFSKKLYHHSYIECGSARYDWYILELSWEPYAWENSILVCSGSGELNYSKALSEGAVYPGDDFERYNKKYNGSDISGSRPNLYFYRYPNAIEIEPGFTSIADYAGLYVGRIEWPVDYTYSDGRREFEYEYTARKVIIPEGVCSVGFCAFPYAEHIQISTTVEKIPFNGVTSPDINTSTISPRIQVTGGPYYSSDGLGAVYSADKSILYYIPDFPGKWGEDTEGMNSYSIPEGVKVIDGGINNTYVHNFYLPQSLEVIKSGFDTKRPCNIYVNDAADWFEINFSSYNPFSWLLDGDTSDNKDIHLFAAGQEISPFEIPEGITRIGDRQFWGINLSNITMPDSVTHIGDYTFSNINFYSGNPVKIMFPNGLLEIGKGAFSGSPLTGEITLPDSITFIGEEAFRNTNITSIKLPKNLNVIQRGVFRECKNLQRVYMPEKIELILSDAFSDCKMLTDIHVSDLMNWAAVNFNAYVGQPAEEMLMYGKDLYCNGSLVTEISLDAENVVQKSRNMPRNLVVNKGAFTGNSNITTISLNEIYDLEEYAFKGCKKLTNVMIKPTLYYNKYGGWNCFEAFADCDNLQTVEFFGNPAVEYYNYQTDTLTVEWTKWKGMFKGVTATIIYPGDNELWKDADVSSWGGNLTLIPKGPRIETEIASDDVYTYPLICGTVYNQNGNSEMQPSMTLTPSEKFTNVELKLTLPEGFSFEEDKLNTEKTVPIGDLPGEDTITLPTIYPIYIDGATEPEDYSIAIDITGTNSSGEEWEGKEKEVFYRPSHTRNTAQNLSKFEAADYVFSLNSAKGSGNTYNQETAQLCALLSNTAYDEGNMEAFLVSGLGFTNYVRYGDTGNLDHKIVRYFASKQIIENGEIKNLVYVVCRGTVTLQEWISNFTTGIGKMLKDHEGFAGAAYSVSSQLKDYYAKNEFSPENTIFVVTGHSRGAAVANLVGQWLNTSAGLASKENISVYTFETPTVNKNIVSEQAGYLGNENIFNFVNYQDAIRNAPSMLYYGRYGSTRYFAFSQATPGESTLFDGFGLYDLPNDGANFTMPELLNSILFECDVDNLISIKFALSDVLRLLKLSILLYGSNPKAMGDELLNAHVSGYYEAAKYNAPYVTADEVNIRTVEAGAYLQEKIKALDAVEDKIKDVMDIVFHGFHCPINLYVYDNNGNLAASIVDKQITCNDENLIVYVNGDELNIGYFKSEQANYTIKVEGYDNGTMTHCIQTVGIDGIKDIQVRRDIPIVKDGIWEVGSDGYIEDASGYTKYEDPQEIEDILTNLDNPAPSHDFQLGDVNHDNKINAKDATLILQSSVGVLKETAKFCETCAEVSGDGKLNAKDSTLILQFSVGLRDSFPAAEK